MSTRPEGFAEGTLMQYWEGVRANLEVVRRDDTRSAKAAISRFLSETQAARWAARRESQSSIGS
jgi:hypothetical protein